MDSSNFFDLTPYERAQIMEQACENGEVENFFDLPPEDRANAYNRAEDY